MAKTRAQLRDGVRYLSDTVNSTLPTDTEINTRLDEAQAEAYDLVVARYDHYYVSTLLFTLTGGQGLNTRNLPADFYKDNGLDKDPNTTSARRIPRLASFQERNNPGIISYTILNSNPGNIIVYPADSAAGNYGFFYTPQVVPFVNDASVLDPTLQLLQDFIMTRAAVTVKVRRQQETGELMQLLGQHKARGMTMLANRMEEPTQSALVDRRQEPWWKTPWP